MLIPCKPTICRTLPLSFVSNRLFVSSILGDFIVLFSLPQPTRSENNKTSHCKLPLTASLPPKRRSALVSVRKGKEHPTVGVGWRVLRNLNGQILPYFLLEERPCKSSFSYANRQMPSRTFISSYIPARWVLFASCSHIHTIFISP